MPAQVNGAVAQLPCAPGRLVYVRLAEFGMVVPNTVAGLIVAAIVAVTDLPGSRHETLIVTNCATVVLVAVKAVPPAQVAGWVVAAVEAVTVPTVRFESSVSVRTISKAVELLLTAALFVKVRV